VQGESAPSLADYLRFEGSGSEWELQLERAHCGRNGWTPVESSPECVRFRDQRRAEPKEVTSLYFRRLRGIVPRSATVHSFSTSSLSRADSALRYDLVRVRIGEHELEFGRPAEDTSHFGVLPVNRIDSVGIDERVRRWAREIELDGDGEETPARP
jgi:hypothetical protein